MTEQDMKPVVEAILMTAGEAVSMERLTKLLADGRTKPKKDEVRGVIDALREDYGERGIELVETAGGYRFRARSEYAERVGRLWEERPPRYSRAFMETLAIIAYRQPITRGEIEHIRGVAVSTNIMRQLLEREWVKVVGHRDVPGRPAVFATTSGFLDYFGLKSLEELPTLADLRAVSDINPDLFAETVPVDAEDAAAANGEAAASGYDDAALSPDAADGGGDDAALADDAGEDGADAEDVVAEDNADDDVSAAADDEDAVAGDTMNESAENASPAIDEDDAATSAAAG